MALVNNDIGSPLPKGGTSDQRAQESPGRAPGRGRGVVGSGYAYISGKLPTPSSAAGNYGGGYAYVSGRRPSGAKRRG